MKIPHPIQYQGSKRNLAPRILPYFPRNIRKLVEPFAGSAAITLAAAEKQLAQSYVINDANHALVELWREIIAHPENLAERYERVWQRQHEHGDPIAWFNRVRADFNRHRRPEFFLFLLARCVKASVRYNADGEFNQSADKRRQGTLPATMREQLLGASYLLRNRVKCAHCDYREILRAATFRDLVYMDPPYQGVSRKRDSRYLLGVDFAGFVEALTELNERNISYIVSYDGRTGAKTYGPPLPDHLHLELVELHAGRSSQATLLGRTDETVESLYLSPALKKRLENSPFSYAPSQPRQLTLIEEPREKKYERLRKDSINAGQPLPTLVKDILDRRPQ